MDEEDEYIKEYRRRLWNEFSFWGFRDPVFPLIILFGSAIGTIYAFKTGWAFTSPGTTFVSVILLPALFVASLWEFISYIRGKDKMEQKIEQEREKRLALKK